MLLNSSLNSSEKIVNNITNNSIVKLFCFARKFEKRFAFTLAEVLITLLIIGIIASIVIPAIISDTQNAELKTAWKKTYSDISQATQRIKMDLGGVIGFETSEEMRDKYLQHLSNVKSCNGSNWGGNCWHKPGDIKYYGGTLFTSTNMDGEFSNNPAVILSNGALVLFVRWDCSNTDVCGHINVDVNGFKEPNTVGKDIFRIWVSKSTIKPQGASNSIYPGTCPSTGGWSCSANYLYQ